MNLPMKPTGIVATMASRYNMDPMRFQEVIKKTIMPSTASNEDMAAFLMVAHEYGLNPILKQIHAFPGRKGGITPIISIDGWTHMVQNHPKCNGFAFAYEQDSEGGIVAVTCTMHRKDWAVPVVVTEFLAENKRNTEPWRDSPAR